MEFISIFKNNFLRYAARKTNIIMMLIITILTVAFAVVFTSNIQVKGNVALVAKDGSLLKGTDSIKVTLLSEEPPMSDLMLGKYDAVVTVKADGTYEVSSIKNAELTNAVKYAIAHPGLNIPGESGRGVGSNILGYLMFFLLLQGVMFIMPLSDDKENGVLKRIGTSPVSTSTYLAAHGLSNFLLVFTPAFAVVAAAKLLGANIGFSLWEYAWLMALLSLLSSAFALLVASALKRMENCSVVGSVVVMFTTLLAGSFIDFSSSRPAFDAVVRVLPQKSFLTLIEGLEKGYSLSVYIPQLTHIVLLIAAFFILGIWITARNMHKGEA